MAIKNTITVEDAIEKLNRLFRVDREAMIGVMTQGVICNRKMAFDEDLEVQIVNPDYVEKLGGEYLVGFMAVVNALFGKEHGLGPISMNFGARCSENGCELPDGAKFGEECPVCGTGLLVAGALDEKNPFGDIRPFIKAFKNKTKDRPEA